MNDCLFGSVDGTRDQAEVILDYILEHGRYACGPQSNPEYWDAQILLREDFDQQDSRGIRGTVAFTVFVPRWPGERIPSFAVVFRGGDLYSQEFGALVDEVARRGGASVLLDVRRALQTLTVVRYPSWSGFEMPSHEDILEHLCAVDMNTCLPMGVGPDPAAPAVDGLERYLQITMQRVVLRRLAHDVARRLMSHLRDTDPNGDVDAQIMASTLLAAEAYGDTLANIQFLPSVRMDSKQAMLDALESVMRHWRTDFPRYYIDEARANMEIYLDE